MLTREQISHSTGSTNGTGFRASLDEAISRTQAYFRRSQHPDGYWWGELESNNTMEAEYVMLGRFLGRQNPEREQHIVRYLLERQKDDGSWAVYYGAPGDLSTSVECYFALKLCGESPEADHMARARRFILSRGGLTRVRVFTRIWLSLLGQWKWSGTPHLLPEMILLPRWAPFNVYHFASWARGCIVPLSIISSLRPVRPVPKEYSIDELLPDGHAGTDYSLPSPGGINLAKLFWWAEKILPPMYNRVPVNPVRKWAHRKSVQWILDHQEADGSWGGIQPPWVYSLMALSVCGFPNSHPVMQRGFDGLEAFGIQKGDHWTVQGCISPVWDTCLILQALTESGTPTDDKSVASATRWLVNKQILAAGDWQVQVPHAQPGGWAFEFENDRYPDIDDTAEVVLALRQGRLPDDEDHLREQAIERAVAWISEMQNRDGGWASFDKNNHHTYLTALAFSDFGEVLDPSSADVTAHVMEMYGRLGQRTDNRALQDAYRYLRAEQEDDGSWFGRWGVNYVYGLGAVLPALEALGEDMTQAYVRRAVEWLLAHQNEDGGWGESCASYVDASKRGVGPSTASQTAWAILALLSADCADYPATRRGVEYLLHTQQPDGQWDQPYFTGTGFPGYLSGARMEEPPRPGERGFQGSELSAGFMINYHLYRNTWPLLALGRYRSQMRQADGNTIQIATPI